MGNISVRKFKREDIDFAHRMTVAEQWNDRKTDVARMFDFEPEGCFIAESNGEPVGHVFSIAYGTLGWIGLLIVSSEHRRRGIGSILMKKAVDYLRGQKVATIKLDAVLEIADLYRKMGFVEEYDSLRFMGTNRSVHPAPETAIEPVEQHILEDIAKFDAEYFGADRSRVLRRLFNENPGLSFVSISRSSVIGYITCRRAESGYKLGPWVCCPRYPHLAEELLATCLSRLEPDAKIYLGLPSPNRAGVKILQKHRFMQYSESIRMRLGGKLETEKPKGIFAIAGPMKG